MSQLIVNTLSGPSNVIRVEYPNTLYAPGHIIQVKWNTCHERAYYTLPTNDGGMRGDTFAEGVQQGGTIIRPLDITIRPRSRNSFIHVEFNLFYESGNDVLFNILRDGQLVGAQFYGEDANAGRWSGAGTARYDNNNDSTPQYINLPWIDRPGTTQPVTYSIAAISSNSGGQTLTLNSTFSNYEFGSDAYEQGVSFSIAQEIAY